MADIVAVWAQVLPEIRKGVTGVGVWTALNACKPITLEDGVAVIGVPHEDSELAGHLRIASTKRLIDVTLSSAFGQTVTARIIEGTTQSDWETVKRRDEEAKRLQEQALAKARAEVQARGSWDTVYEQIGRLYASVPNKSLPQNRAKFFEEAVKVLIERRKAQPEMDDLSERNFARCLERVSQYSEIPSTIVAMHVLQGLA